MVSPIIPGDIEMQRTTASSPLVWMVPSVDLYFRSARDMQREAQQVRLNLVEVSGVKRFRGALSLLHRASRIVDIAWSGTLSVASRDSYTVYSQSTRADLYGSLHCGTRYEELFVDWIPLLDGYDLPLFPIREDDDGQYAIFTVTYDADPLLETVSSVLESTENKPVGVDLLVKSGPLALVDNLNITYTRKYGTKTTLSAARSKIVDYLRYTGYPEMFGMPQIHNIMRNAGADRVTSISATGRVLVSAATRLFRNTVTDPVGDDLLTVWVDSSDEFLVLPIVSEVHLAHLNTIIDDEISVGGPADAWAATNRTVRFYVDADNILFIEI